MPDGRAPEPIDWATARWVARRAVRRDPFADSYLGTSLERDFAAVTEEAEALVSDHTGLRTPGRATTRVLDRAGWADANLASMRRLLAPATQRLGERIAASPTAPLTRRAAAAEVGLLVGLLAQRVLGQYDLLVPDDGGEIDDAVYYVGPNVLALEKRFAFRPVDFRRWIAIHEVTHRAQFTGVPWLRPHFLSLVERLLGVVDIDPATLLDSLRRAVDDLRRGVNPLDEGGVAAIVAPPEQRAALREVQSLMTLLEGHGNVVMQDLGVRHVHGADRMARVLKARRQSRGLVGLLQRLLGMEAKLRQYEAGEQFVRAVQREGGPHALDAAWRSPVHLPTLAEMADPVVWLARVGSTAPGATSAPALSAASAPARRGAPRP